MKRSVKIAALAAVARAGSGRNGFAAAPDQAAHHGHGRRERQQLSHGHRHVASCGTRTSPASRPWPSPPNGSPHNIDLLAHQGRGRRRLPLPRGLSRHQRRRRPIPRRCPGCAR
ncbi:MAG: hypothetical protein M0C28_30200 [Candidatus Moduliflexus flocculans]|nr:hypothetical protein [Candidatus Moduliflexus flocculans]